MSLLAIKYQNRTLEILDQLLLPFQSKYIPIRNVEDGWKAINKMQVCSITLLIFTRSTLKIINKASINLN